MIVATTCVNYAEYLKEGLEAMSQLCDTIFLLDDDPTGEVEAIANDFPKVDWQRWDKPYHEAQTRAYGLKVALVEHNADWVFPFDGDEVLDNPSQLRRDIQAHSWGGTEPNCIPGHDFHFWDSREFYRTDGGYGTTMLPRMFYVADRRDELVKAAEEWARTGNHCHAGYMPTGGWRVVSGPAFRIRHYAFMSPERRREKHAHYNRFSPDRDYSRMIDEKVALKRWEP